MNRFSRPLPNFLPLALGMLLAATAGIRADVVQPASITYTGTNPDAGIAGITNTAGLIDGTGLSSALTAENIDTVTHNNPFAEADNAWATDDPNGGFGNDFFESGGSQGSVVFELQFTETQELDQFYAWSYDFDEAKPNANNIKTIDVEYGIGDFLGGTLTNVSFTAPLNNLPAVASLGGISADRLRITVTDNWFDGNNLYQGGDRVAAAEFAFTTLEDPGSANSVLLGELVNRLLPGRAEDFEFSLIHPDAGRDCFEIEAAADGKIAIRGNTNLSVASGFNWYLKHVADCHVSWNGTQLNLPDPAPAPVGLIRQVSPYQHRNQGNVTAACYTQAYWNWARWEKEIDFMALNGITQAVVVPGHQKVWQETLQRLGYSNADIEAYIPNLGHTCWWLFGNLEGEGGPLPQDVIDGEAVLGRQIADRMREYGIEPIVYGYVGLVPNSFPNYFPSATVIDQGQWLNYARPDVLSPLDPQFATTAAIWYEELADVYGPVKFLSGDLFHEGGNTGGLNLTSAAAAVQSAMQTALPGSTWVIQSWGGTPNSSLVAGTSIEHTLIQQLISDMATGEGEGGGFRTYQGRPWTWNEISNFGGNNGLYGNLRVLANLPNQLLAPTNLGRFSGLGVFMEAIEVNPIYFDLLTDMVWRTTPPDLESWLNDALRRRYGSSNAGAEQAWALLRDSVYDVPVFQYGVTDFVIAARPGPNVSKARLWGDNRQYWNPWDVARAAEKMVAAAPALGSREGFRFDLIDILRQTLNDHTFAVYQEMMDAFNAADSARFETEAARLLAAIDHLDALLATHPQWMIGPWIADARAKSADPATRELMETNARQLVTTWTQVDNPGLNDYASRSRSGLVGDYYKHRWQIYIDDLRDALAGTGSGNYSGVGFELGWRSDRSGTYPTAPSTDTITVANQLWADIGADIMATAEANGRWRWILTQGGATETLTWDVTDLISSPTRLAVVFDYQAGAHALQIDQLELLRNGAPIASDTHDGWTGSIDDDHAYSLAFTSAHTPGDTYTLRATVSGAGGGDSSGILHVSVPGFADDDSFTGRYRRSTGSAGQHETLDLNADHSLQRYVDGSPVTTYDNHTWQQTDGLLEIRNGSGTIVSHHTLTDPDTLTTNDGWMTRLATAVSVTEWAQDLGLSAPDDAADADPDGDRLTNLTEMALGTDPRIPDGNPTTASFDTAAGTLDFSFNRPALHRTLGFHYTLQTSPDLAEDSWGPVIPDAVTIVAHPADPALEVVTITAPLSSHATAFYRLAVSGHE